MSVYLKKGYYPFFIGKFSSQEIESEYNWIKMLLVEPEKYRNAINATSNEISLMTIELEKTWGRKYYIMNERQTLLNMIINFLKSSN